VTGDGFCKKQLEGYLQNVVQMVRNFSLEQHLNEFKSDTMTKIGHHDQENDADMMQAIMNAVSEAVTQDYRKLRLHRQTCRAMSSDFVCIINSKGL
ncbi:hypothetical protein LSAT2_007175, partial [Lamellibrachia satsuma]